MINGIVRFDIHQHVRALVFLLMVFTVLATVPCAIGSEAPETVSADSKPFQTIWVFAATDSVGGHQAQVLGDPVVVPTHEGPSVVFDGVDDGLQYDTLPLAGAGQFTVEILFRPDPDGLPEQRYFHMQENGSDNRVMLETRLTGDGMWYLDTFIKSGDADRTLKVESALHPVGEWYVCTLVFDGTEMRHYVNGVLEASGTLSEFSPLNAGRTSVGVRMNEVHWFKGAVRLARFTGRVLSPDEFIFP